MCCRCYVNNSTEYKDFSDTTVKRGELYPTDIAAVLISEKSPAMKVPPVTRPKQNRAISFFESGIIKSANNKANDDAPDKSANALNDITKKVKAVPPRLDFGLKIAPPNGVTFAAAKWGILGFNDKPIINARSETVTDKRMFNGFFDRRVLLACNGYFEWDRQKRKRFIHSPLGVTYLCGLANALGYFAVITRAAYCNLLDINSRAPLTVSENDCARYLNDTDFAISVLNSEPNLVIEPFSG